MTLLGRLSLATALAAILATCLPPAQAQTAPHRRPRPGQSVRRRQAQPDWVQRLRRKRPAAKVKQAKGSHSAPGWRHYKRKPSRPKAASARPRPITRASSARTPSRPTTVERLRATQRRDALRPGPRR